MVGRQGLYLETMCGEYVEDDSAWSPSPGANSPYLKTQKKGRKKKELQCVSKGGDHGEKNILTQKIVNRKLPPEEGYLLI